jgi:hypothetical protein
VLLWSLVVVSGVGHYAVVGEAGTGAAGAGAVAAEHLGCGPAVEFHKVSFGPGRVPDAVSSGTRRVYGSYWNRVVQAWGPQAHH